jgi:phage gpG-like protein
MGDLSIELDVSDLKKLQTDIENVVKTVTKEGEGSVIAKAALVVERQAKINASGRPGPNVITGRLRASIIPHIISYTEATVGTNVEYAPFVEFGHLIGIGIGSRGGLMTNTSKMTPFHMGQRRTNAYPFLYPAIDQCKSELEGVFVSFSSEIEGQWQ